jgi:hypothetical protein
MIDDMKMIDDKTQTFNLLPLITDPLIDYSSVALLLLLPAATCCYLLLPATVGTVPHTVLTHLIPCHLNR